MRGDGEGPRLPAPHKTAGSGQWASLRGASARQRRALVSGWVGFFVDMVDIYLPVIALAPAMVHFQPETLTDPQAATLFFATFAATLLGRPIGAVVFGHLADTRGRRGVTLLSIAGFSCCTFAIGLLPGYASWGLVAPAALVALRFIDGLFLGGEYTAATPLAFEHCPPHARGLFGGLLMGAYAAGYAAVSAVVLVLLLALPEGAYATWGWRVPFLLGGALGFAFLLWRTRVPESPLWQAERGRAGRAGRKPLLTVLTGAIRCDFAQVLVLMTGLWLIATSVVSVLPLRLLTSLDRSPTWVTAVLLVAQLAVAAGFVAVGVASQRSGRRVTLIRGALVSGTAGLACYLAVMTVPMPGWLLAAAVMVTEAVTLAVWGVVTSYCNERFATRVRATGFGTAYSLALIPAGLYPLYLTGLGWVLPTQTTQLVLLAAGSVLAVVGAAWGPETRDVDLAADPAPVRGGRGRDARSADAASREGQ
jgi:MFS family permease